MRDEPLQEQGCRFTDIIGRAQRLHRVLINTKFGLLFGFGSSAHSRGFLHSDLVEEIRHLAFYNAGMPNIRIVTSVVGRALRSIRRASALPGLYKTTPVYRSIRRSTSLVHGSLGLTVDIVSNAVLES